MLASSNFSGQLSTTFHSSVFMQRLIELCSSGRGSSGAGRQAQATPYTHTHSVIHNYIPPLTGDAHTSPQAISP